MGFVISQIIKGDRGKRYQPKPKAEAESYNTYRDLHDFGFHKNRIK